MVKNADSLTEAAQTFGINVWVNEWREQGGDLKGAASGDNINLKGIIVMGVPNC